MRLEYEPIKHEEWQGLKTRVKSEKRDDFEGIFAWIVLAQVGKRFASELSNGLQFWIGRRRGREGKVENKKAGGVKASGRV